MRVGHTGSSCGTRALIVAFASVALFLPASAQPRCVFLECGPANTPNPDPPKAPTVARVTPTAPPQHEALQRTRLEGETCDDVGGFRYCVSSVLEPQFGFNYLPRNLVDTDLKTAWVEGKSGHGEGESLTVDLNGLRTVTAIQVMNGYHKNERLFLANSRVHIAELQFSNGETRKVSLADAPGLQTIEVGRQKASWVRFTIRSVYPGNKYKDTAITEFRVVTQN
ncbi:MAG TPA: discoidin domain-containing protein [Hyphomicrobiaceae bacterium]|nr:discoidin domain-containing protein [Hyphomicrobiaceae bacterium]